MKNNNQKIPVIDFGNPVRYGIVSPSELEEMQRNAKEFPLELLLAEKRKRVIKKKNDLNTTSPAIS